MKKLFYVILCLFLVLILLGATRFVSNDGRGLPRRIYDLRVPLSTARILGVGADADFDVFRGTTRAFSFDPDTNEEVYFAVQMPHGYLLGSNFTPHIHWTPSTAGAGNVRWCLECTWANHLGTFADTSGSPVCVNGSAGGTAYAHQITEFADTSGALFTALSAMGVCRLYRDANDAVNDTYAADVFGLEIGFHITLDEIGSMSSTSKW